MRLKLVDLDRGAEVEVEIEREAHPTGIVDRLRELGLLNQHETAIFGVSLDGRRVHYVPAATVEQLAAYSSQTKQPICFKRFAIHRHQP
ncbi:MAG: hypothetical protein ACK4SY_01705 [Pyrobaculum sp.]